MPYSIMLDAGHGGRDPGAIYKGRMEKDDNLRLVLALGEILKNNGVDVGFTRTTDVYQSPYEKAMEANNANSDFFISIHRNSFPTDNVVSGVESLVFDKEGTKLDLAENINSELASVGFENLGITARPNLVVLRRTQMPAVMVEVGFINSNTDNQIFDQNFDEIAQAIAKGIMDTLNADKPADSAQTYTVQVGAFRNPTYANRFLNELLEQDFPAAIVDANGLLRVQVGEFKTLEGAADMERRLKSAGYPTIVVTR
ncbi:MAG: N-acetylmuramoyl-L-alanine amidase [Muricomes sp.]